MSDPAQKTSPQKNIVSLSPQSASAGNSQEESSGSYTNSLIQTYEARISQLHGWLEAERQNYRELERQSRKDKNELEEKITELSQKLREDNTETKLEHKDEIFQLKEAHRAALDEKKEEISRLERKIEIENLKQSLGGKRGVGDRVLDMIEENGGDFLANLLSSIQQIAAAQQTSPQQLSNEQYQQALANAQQQSQQQPGSPNPAQAEQETPRTATSTPQPPNLNAGRIGDTDDNPPDIQKPETSNQQQEFMAAAKNQFQTVLLERALDVLVNPNANLAAYAEEARNIISLHRQQGITLDAQAWTNMAKTLAETAVAREITPDRVARVIRPALDSVKEYAWMLSMANPAAVTDKLFQQFNIKAAPPVKKLVTQVLAAIQKSL